jgi:uncharacterized integral membrane protein (TIGR00698 family)
MVVRNVKAPAVFFNNGIAFSEKTLLSWAIALMGVNLDYGLFQELGLSFILIIISGICVTIPLALLAGRLMNVDRDLALLIGVGNAVCGSSAIAAAQSVVKADEDKVGVSIAVINFLGTLGIFILPALVMIFPFLTETRGAVLIGNTLQAIGQVTAAGFSIGETTGQIATLVKMGRILMIMPVVLTLSLVKKDSGGGTSGKRVGIPWYITGFLIFSLLGTFHILPEMVVSWIHEASKALLVTAMGAIGMKITLSTLKGEGLDALLIGHFVFFFQILFSMGLAFFLV